MEVRRYGGAREDVSIPDLIEIQTKSYEDFLQQKVPAEKRENGGLESLLREIFPIESYDGKYRLEYLRYELGKPLYTIEQCRQLRLTYGLPFRIWVRLVKEQPVEEEVYLGEIPVMIGGGEFIINGAERVIVSQLHRSPGVDFMVDTETGDRRLHACRIIPERGSWVEMNVTKKEILMVRIDQSGKFPVTMLLRAMSQECSTNAAITRAFHKTKQVELKDARSFRSVRDRFVVEDIVNAATGEVVLESGAQINEQNFAGILDALAGIQRTPGDTCAKPVEWMRANLELKGVELDEKLRDSAAELAAELDRITDLKRAGRKSGKNAVKRLLGYCEDRLLVEFPGSREELEGKACGGHVPALNSNKATEAPKSDAVERIKKAWDEQVPAPLKEWLDKCLAQAGKAQGWLDLSDELDYAGISDQPGVYFARDKTEKSVEKGYIGVGGPGRDGGVRGRWKNSHLAEKKRAKGKLNDSLQLSVSQISVAETVVPEQPLDTPRVVEVIDEENPDLLILNSLADDPSDSTEMALLRIYARLRPGNPAQIEKARDLFREKFFDENRYRLGNVGRFRMNRKFGTDVPEGVQTLQPEDVVNCIKYVLGLRRGEGRIDDIDHLGNRRVRTISELAIDEIRKGLLKLRRTVQERMSLGDAQEMTPRTLINSKTVSSSIEYFFGRGELSQVVDQTNPLSQLAHERRLSALGPGGLNRKRAGFEVRDVHISHYGRICPIETPEGANIGLISNLGLFARVDEYGFLITPYKVVKNGKVTDEIVYLRADEEENQYIAPADQDFGRRTILARLNGDFLEVDKGKVHYADVSARQLVGVSAGLIPFLEHDDANRALMGSNMQRQSVPLIRCEPPIVATGLEKLVPLYSGMVVTTEEAGKVTHVTADEIVIDERSHRLRKFVGLNERTCLNQKPIVNVGDRVSKGQVIADGAGTKDGELALGRNILVGFMPWDGYNYEDAILVSEKLVEEDAYTSIHIEEFEVEIRETKLGREEFTRDIPNVSEKELANLDDHGIIRVGMKVQPGDILVGKIAPKSKSELTPEEKLLQAIFGRAGEDVKNDSLVVPAGIAGIVIHNERFQRKVHLTDIERLETENLVRLNRDEYSKKKIEVLRVTLEAIEDIVGGRLPLVGKKRPLPRAKTASAKKMTDLVEKLKFDGLELSRPKKKSAAVKWEEYVRQGEELDEECEREVGRIRRGDKLPTGVLELVKVYVATKRTLAVGDKMAGRHGNKGVIAKILPVEDMPFLEDGTPLDILLNPLGVPSRMNVGQILETHLGWAARALGFKAICPVFDGASEEEIIAALAEAGLPEDGKAMLCDGRTGEPFAQKVTVGYIYMMKLHHLVDDKVHARATGPYSLITQQPLGGKARSGGQRFGEMEVWALEAYGAAHVLQEILTVKSDDVEGRTKIYESMIKGENTLEAGTPVSFEVLTNEIRGLCLNMELMKKRAAI